MTPFQSADEMDDDAFMRSVTFPRRPEVWQWHAPVTSMRVPPSVMRQRSTTWSFSINHEADQIRHHPAGTSHRFRARQLLQGPSRAHHGSGRGASACDSPWGTRTILSD
jgi:hypothetical protein